MPPTKKRTAKKGPAKKRTPRKVVAKPAEVVLITRPRETASMRVIAFLEKRGPGEFTVPEVRDGCGLLQQHAYAIVAAMVRDGKAARADDDTKRGRRGTYTTEVKVA